MDDQERRCAPDEDVTTGLTAPAAGVALNSNTAGLISGAWMSPSDVKISPAALAAAKTQTGESLADLSRHAPVLVVFLRHSGCPFCRQALADLSEKQQAIASAGAGSRSCTCNRTRKRRSCLPVMASTMYRGSAIRARRCIGPFNCRGSLAQVTGPRVWGAGLKSLLSGNVPGIPSADVLQMPGVFLVHDGRVRRSFRHATSGDRPDYVDLATCPLGERGA